MLPSALLSLLLVSEWKLLPQLGGLIKVFSADELGFGLPGKITEVERIPPID